MTFHKCTQQSWQGVQCIEHRAPCNGQYHKQPLPRTVVTQGRAVMTHNVQGSNRGNNIGHVQQSFTKIINCFLKISTSTICPFPRLQCVMLTRSINKSHLQVQGAGMHLAANISQKQNTLETTKSTIQPNTGPKYFTVNLSSLLVVQSSVSRTGQHFSNATSSEDTHTPVH